MGDTTILVGVVTAVFVGVAGLVKMTLPFIAKRRSDRPAATATALAAAAVMSPQQPDNTGPYAAVDVPRPPPTPSAPWEAFTQTLHDVQSKVDNLDLFATKADMAALSSSMKKDREKLEARVDKNAEKTQNHLTKLERVIGRLEGKMDK